jgi:hypothetical protein
LGPDLKLHHRVHREFTTETQRIYHREHGEHKGFTEATEALKIVGKTPGTTIPMDLYQTADLLSSFSEF